MFTAFVSRLTRGALSHDADFRKVWIGETVSQLGGQVTLLAIPLTGALLLHATPAEMGILAACGLLPYLLFGLPAGVWVDRVRRRPILVASAVGMAASLMIVPIAYVAGVLSMPILYVAALTSGTGGMIYDIATQAYLPTLIERRDLVEGNSKLELSRSGAMVAGPGLGGLLVSIVSAPIAILVDSLALFTTALMLLFIRRPEAPPRPPGRMPGIRHEIREGLHLVFGNRILLAIASTMGTYFFFDSVVQSVFILYVTRDLGMGPGELGVALAIGNLGFLPGALLASRIGGRIGIGPTLIVAILTASVAGLLLPIATPATAFPLLVLSRFGASFGIPLFMINQISLRQSITPDRLLGRLSATMKFVGVGVAPIGAFVGGALGSAIGVHGALVVGVIGGLGAVTWLVNSPVRHLRAAPAPWSPDELLAATAEAEAEAILEGHRATR